MSEHHQRQGAHEAEGAGLSEPIDVDSRRAQCREHNHSRAHDRVAPDDHRGKPDGHRSENGYRDNRGDDYDPVDERIDDLADCRYLFETACNVTVEKIGDAGECQEHEGEDALVVREQRDNESCRQAEAGNRDSVRHCPDPRQRLGLGTRQSRAGQLTPDRGHDGSLEIERLGQHFSNIPLRPESEETIPGQPSSFADLFSACDSTRAPFVNAPALR